MSLELQNIDCNCNNCIYMTRDFDKFKSFDSLYDNMKNASHRINYGKCSKFNKDISFIPNSCQVYTQECFKNRKEK